MMPRSLTFDASPGAPPLFKERALWTLVMGLFFFLVYGSANEISSLTAPHPSVVFGWEKNLPFVPELIVPYMSSDLVFVIAFLMAPTRGAIQKLGLRSGLMIVISAAFFLAMPLAFSFQRPEVAGWPAIWFDLLSLDKPFNQFPSLHISLGFLAWHTITARMPPLAKALTTGWFLLILASTLLVYQHHFIDLPGGVIVAVLVFWLVPDKGHARISLRFVSPRHLHMAFRYLILAAILAVLAFKTEPHSLPAALLIAWVSVSLLLVAGSYVLGANDFLKKRNGRHPTASWLLYWPYLLGSLLNWRYWRSKVPMMAEIQPELWIGARPSGGDWREVQGRGIVSVIDLASELPSAPPPGIDYAHFPFLDIAIPDPVLLDQAAERIGGAAAQGPVFIHCALGMSRSVLAACAWLIKNGATPQEALAAVDRARPERVSRPYMTISLNLYEQYVQNGSYPHLSATAPSSSP